MGIYAALLQAMQNKNGGAQGFTSPGNGAPQMPAQQLAAGAMPQGAAPVMGMPGATQGMPAGATGAPTGMFAQLANNPMLMKMMMGQGQTQQAGAGAQMQQPMTGQQPMQQPAWLQQLMASMRGTPTS